MSRNESHNVTINLSGFIVRWLRHLYLMVGDAVTDLKAAQYYCALFYGRGEQFSKDNVPWSEDLIGLVDYLSCNFLIYDGSSNIF